MKLLLNFVCFLVGITLFNAQNTFTVSGTVQDFHDKTLLKDARVTIGEKSTLTDAQGRFTIRNITEGKHNLTAAHPACEPFSEVIEVSKNLDISLNLEHHIHDIETVALHRRQTSAGLMTVKTLDENAIARNSTENLGNILQRISGVGTLKTGNSISKPVIHGLYGSRISIINNGVRMAEQEWGVEHAPSIETTNFERINVIKGSGTLKYSGDAVGGVVVLEPKMFPARDSIMGESLISGISNGRGAKVGVDLAKIWQNRWFVRGAGTYQKLGDLYIPHHTLQNTGTEEHSMNFSFGNRNFVQGFEASYSGISQNFGIFRGSHLGGPEDFYNAVANGNSVAYYDDFQYKIMNPKQEVNHHIAKLEAYKRFYGFGKLSFHYSFQLNNRKEYDLRRGELNDLPSMDLRLITHQAKLEHLIEREKWQLESGISGALQDNYPNPATQARRLIPDYYRYDVGLFSVFQYKFSKNLNAEFGARYDFNRYDAYKYYDENEWESRFENLFSNFVIKRSGSRVLTRPVLDFHNISANMGITYKPYENWDLTVNVSRASRTPNAAELFADGLHHSAAIIERGDLSIKKEEVYHFNLSAKGKIPVLKGLQVEINPYLMTSDNFINQVPTGIQNSNRGIFMIWDYHQTKARIYGIDADLELNFTNNFKWNSQVSALRGDDLKNNEPLILMMPVNFKNFLEFSLGKPSNFYFTLENETFLKQNRFPVRNVNLDLIENGQLVTRTLDTSTPPAGYSVFNAAAGMDVFRNFNVNFRINNLLNTEYRDYLNRLRFFAPELGRSLILTLKYNF